MKATLLILDAAGNRVTTIEAGPDGNYARSLAPGTFRIVPETPPGSPFPRAEEIEVVLEAGIWMVVNISYDSGIR